MLLPDHQCQLCATRLPGSRPFSLCRACEEELPWLPPGCPGCGLADRVAAGAGPLCSACLREPFPWQQLRGLFEYVAPVDRMIRRFKDQGDLVAGRSLSHLMAGFLVRTHQEEVRPLPNALLAVPIHRRQLARRGFNQARLLALQIARLTSIPLLEGTILRRDLAIDQRSLRRGARYTNMEQAFTTAQRRNLTAPPRVAIIDDVVTTGATASALARLLRTLGTRHIDVWCLARVDIPD